MKCQPDPVLKLYQSLIPGCLLLRFYNILGPLLNCHLKSFFYQLMPKDISGGGLVGFEFEITQICYDASVCFIINKTST